MNKQKSRRKFLCQTAAVLAGFSIASCARGGDSSAGDIGTQATNPGGKTGTLVYRNGSVAATYNFETNLFFEFDPGVPPNTGVGISVSRSGKIVTAHQGDRAGNEFFIALYDTQGKMLEKIGITRALSFLNSAIIFSPDESKIAFTVNEEQSSTNSNRISRTLIIELSSGRVLAELNNKEDPCFSVLRGDIYVRESNSGIVRIYDSSFNDLGTISGVDVSQLISGFTVSPNGQFIVWEDGLYMNAFDRESQQTWVVAEDKLSSVHSPVFSPNGDWLAMHSRIMVTTAPHVVPFSLGKKTQLDSNTHALPNINIVETTGRMGWF